MVLPSAIAVAMTGFADFSPRTTSSSCITFAGLKKCIPTTSCGRFVIAAIWSMSSADVLLARIAPGFIVSSSFLKICFFRSRFSYTASITTSASASAA